MCPDCYLSSSDVWYLVKLLSLDHMSEPGVLHSYHGVLGSPDFVTLGCALVCKDLWLHIAQFFFFFYSDFFTPVLQIRCFYRSGKPVYTSRETSTFSFKPFEVLLQELKIKIIVIKKNLERNFREEKGSVKSLVSAKL